MKLLFAKLDHNVNISNFDCGQNKQNNYLQQFATVNQKRYLGVTIIATSLENSKIVGFYTIATAQVETGHLPKKYGRSLPHYPIPAIRICQLAVDLQFQGKGYGKKLLMHALLKCYQLAEEVAGHLIVVDAANIHLRRFYEGFGFVPLNNSLLNLFVPMKVVAKLARASVVA